MKPPAAATSSANGNRPSLRSSGHEFRSIQSQVAKAQPLAQAEAQITTARPESATASEGEYVKAVKKRDRQRIKVRKREFKAQHAGILGMLAWIL